MGNNFKFDGFNRGGNKENTFASMSKNLIVYTICFVLVLLGIAFVTISHRKYNK